jgi:hypothetical protein
LCKSGPEDALAGITTPTAEWFDLSPQVAQR